MLENTGILARAILRRSSRHPSRFHLSPFPIAGERRVAPFPGCSRGLALCSQSLSISRSPLAGLSVRRQSFPEIQPGQRSPAGFRRLSCQQVFLMLRQFLPVSLSCFPCLPPYGWRPTHTWPGTRRMRSHVLSAINQNRITSGSTRIAQTAAQPVTLVVSI